MKDVHPLRNATCGPKASRKYTYSPPACGLSAASSAYAMAPAKASAPPASQTANVAELAVLQHLGARLRRIAGIAGLGPHGDRRGLVAVERQALDEALVKIFFRATRARQALEGNIERKRTEVVVGGLVQFERDA